MWSKPQDGFLIIMRMESDLFVFTFLFGTVASAVWTILVFERFVHLLFLDLSVDLDSQASWHTVYLTNTKL